MFSEDGPALDREAMDEALEEADVIVLGFDFTDDRLLIDLRDDPRGRTPPIVEIVEPLADAEERRIWLSARRPGLRPPEELLFFVWPHTVASLQASPLIDGAARRIEGEQRLNVRVILGEALDDLRGRERRDLASAVRGGEGFETLWSRLG